MPLESARSVLAKIAAAAAGEIITLEGAAAALDLDRRSATRRLSALVAAGWLSRVRRGVFAVKPLDSAPGVAVGEEDPWALAMEVFAPCYIGGWSAAAHLNLTEQLFRVTLVVTMAPVRRSNVNVGSSSFHLVRQTRSDASGLLTVWRGRSPIRVSGVERTIADSCVTPSWAGGGRSLIDIFRSAVETKQISAERMAAQLQHRVSGASLGRLGYLVERYWPDAQDVLQVAKEKRGTGNVRFDPSVADKGRLVRRWGLWLNVSFPEPTE
jgi:predicted transcriptional regulator of viral defense system